MSRTRAVLTLVGFFVLMGGLFVAANGGWW
jgi:hypothetical protein